MQKITIEFTGKHNFILYGEVIEKSYNRNTVGKIRFIDEDNNEEISFPNSSPLDKSTLMAIKTDISRQKHTRQRLFYAVLF